MAWWALIILLIASVEATPRAAFPINSQVPPVARVSEPFSFTFSDSTFTSDFGSISYALKSAPSWLQLNGGSRTLSGTPSPSDAGPAVFAITASDSSGSMDMETTLIVSAEPAPTVGTTVGQQLPSFGTVSGPSSLLLSPSTSFNFSFSQSTFVDNGRTLGYYAVSSNNSPLPSWINFNGDELQFSGMTPDILPLSGPPQTFGITLIASDIVGFSGVSVFFGIIVGSHQLHFRNVTEAVNASKGTPFNYTFLESQLQLDGEPVQSSDIQNATAALPGWLSFDEQTLSITGTPPPEASSQNITVTVRDAYEDVASTTIFLNIQSALFSSQVGQLNATIGKTFDYVFHRSLFSIPNFYSTMDLGSAAPWLNYDNTTLQLQGNVPENIQSSSITVTLNAFSESSSVTDSQSFEIQLMNHNVQTSRHSSSPTSYFGGTATSTSSSTAATASSAHRISKATIAVAVVVPVLVLAAIALCFICAHRRRRKWQERPLSPAHRNISRPIIHEEPEEDEQWHDEKIESFHKRTSSRPPRLSLSSILHSSTNLSVLRQGRHKPKAKSIDEKDTSRASENGEDLLVLPYSATTRGVTPNYSLKTVTAPVRPVRASIASNVRRSSKRSSRSSARGPGLPVSRPVSGIGHGSGGYGSQNPGVVERLWSNPATSSIWETLSNVSGQTEATDVLNEFPLPPRSSHGTSSFRPLDGRMSIRAVTSPNPARLSIGAARRDYIRRRNAAESPWFAGGSSRASSHSRTSRVSRASSQPRGRNATRHSSLPPFSLADISHQQPPPQRPTHTLQRQDTLGSIYSQASNINIEPPLRVRKQRSPRHSLKRFGDRLSHTLLARLPTRSSLQSSRKFESADSSSCDNFDAGTLSPHPSPIPNSPHPSGIISRLDEEDDESDTSDDDDGDDVERYTDFLDPDGRVQWYHANAHDRDQKRRHSRNRRPGRSCPDVAANESGLGLGGGISGANTSGGLTRPGRDSIGNIIEYSPHETPRIEIPRLGVAVQRLSDRDRRVVGVGAPSPLSIISSNGGAGGGVGGVGGGGMGGGMGIGGIGPMGERFRLVEHKGKRPVSVDSSERARAQGSQSGSVRFI
ncbi:MAG: hypothetical protein M1819_001983 [Sarea resinae]|nr:MAG: hypothetical protein M1819_001983 [Sarea resinae]